MTLNSKGLAIILVALLFGGIALSASLGWWQTSSDRVPARYTEGAFAGQANPADIRGSYTFGDIAAAFNIKPDILAQAFGVATDDPAAFKVKDLESIYASSPLEVGTASVRIFVALYLGLPYELDTATEAYLPAPAANILAGLGTLSAEQQAWLASHTVDLTEADAVSQPEIPVKTESETGEASAYMIKGKTTFGELISWGVAQATIEQVINAPMPNPAMTVKDYAFQNGLAFETLKFALQAEVDKVRK